MQLSAVSATTIPVAGSDEIFAVRRVYCVGQNYRNHAIEMGSNPDREAPFFFSKPADAVFRPGGPVPFPARTEKLSHEVELVVAIGARADRVDKEHALEKVWGYTVGID